MRIKQELHQFIRNSNFEIVVIDGPASEIGACLKCQNHDLCLQLVKLIGIPDNRCNDYGEVTMG